MAWDYKREERKFDEIPVGEHRVRIASAEKATSKNGNEMLTLKLDVSGYSAKIWHHVVFLPDNPQITNRNLTAIFDSFGIADGDFNLKNWEGKVGGCMTKEDDYGIKVRYFLSKKKQEQLPAWQDAPGGNGSNGGSAAPAQLTPVDDEDLPF